MWTEKRALQFAVTLACVVPLLGGGGGVVFGPGMLNGPTVWPADADSHFRYLSGLLLAIGLIFLASVPGIERHGGRVRLLTLLVVLGGLARLLSLLAVGQPSPVMLAALAMELAVTPALAVWQARVARGQ